MHGCGVCSKQVVHLVPFDLEGDEDGDDVVGVADAGNVDGKGFFAVVEPFAPAGGSGDGFPGIDRKAVVKENLFGLA